MIKNKKQIFLLYTCFSWGDQANDMTLFCVTTSPTKVKSIIIKQILDGNMFYGSDEISENKQVELFKKDWKIKTRYYINTQLLYGFYDYHYDGEDF